MRRHHRVSSVAMVLLATGALAQEGFPLDGTWRGQLEPSAGAPGNLVIVMKWDGRNINGTINPGPNATEFSNATLDPSDWSVVIEAQPSDGTAIVFTGTLREIGSYNRYIEGTWTRGGSSQALTITRE